MTIGVVCKGLAQEFPDISISKIRYLEDQKLLNPRRTAGGYRLYSPSDMVRLRTILRLQRDEFLPLRVIRQELASGRASDGDGKVGTPEASQAAIASKRKRRASVSVTDGGAMYALEDVLEETRADPALVRELEDYGVIKSELRAGKHYYDETEREIIGAVTELARYGVGGRNLRVFRSSADREAALLQQILAPGPALAQSRAPQGGARGAREPRRGRDAPQAPAADPRPAQDRGIAVTSTAGPSLRGPKARSAGEPDPVDPRLPQAGDRLSRHHAAARRPGGARRRRRRADRADARPAPGRRHRRRGARLSVRPGARPRARRRVRAGAQAGRAAAQDDLARVRAGVRRERAGAARGRDHAGQPRARPRRPAGDRRHGEARCARSSSSSAARSSAARFSSSSRSCRAARRWRRTRRARSSATTRSSAAVPTVRRSRTLRATPEEVWAIVGDAYHLPRWWPRVTRVEGVEGGAVHAGADDGQGRAGARRLPRRRVGRAGACGAGSSSSSTRRSSGSSRRRRSRCGSGARRRAGDGRATRGRDHARAADARPRRCWAASWSAARAGGSSTARSTGSRRSCCADGPRGGAPRQPSPAGVARSCAGYGVVVVGAVPPVAPGVVVVPPARRRGGDHAPAQDDRARLSSASRRSRGSAGPRGRPACRATGR